MKLLPLIGGTLLGLATQTTAMNLIEGVTIDVAAAAMNEAGHKRAYPQMVALDHAEELFFWDVNKGMIGARYSKQTRKIIDVTFSIADARPKTKGESVNFKLVAFDTKTGVLTTACGKKMHRISPTWHESCEFCRLVREPAQAEQKRADQPATQPTVDHPVNDQPSPPASKDAPR